MDREKANRQIERIISAIEGEQFPVRVKELYVFGSYSRGAANPNDLDLILIHEPPASELLERFRADIVSKYGENFMYWPRGVWPERRFESSMTTIIRRPGEKMDILLATSMEKVAEMGDNIANAHRVLIWSESDRDWKAKLKAIKPDPTAGRYERAHFANLKRFNGDVRAMLNVTEAVKQGFLKLTRIDTAGVDPILNPMYQHWYDWWVKCGVMGKDSMKLLRHGMWWMQQQRDQSRKIPHPPQHDGTMCSEDRNYAVYFGKPPLYAVYRVCRKEHRYRRICLIPHFKKDEANEMFVFERGQRTSLKELDVILHNQGF